LPRGDRGKIDARMSPSLALSAATAPLLVLDTGSFTRLVASVWKDDSFWAWRS
jgi:hypothetical protein